AQALGPPALRWPRQDSLPGGRRDEAEARHNEGSQNRCRRLELSEGLSQRRRFANRIHDVQMSPANRRSSVKRGSRMPVAIIDLPEGLRIETKTQLVKQAAELMPTDPRSISDGGKRS